MTHTFFSEDVERAGGGSATCFVMNIYGDYSAVNYLGSAWVDAAGKMRPGSPDNPPPKAESYKYVGTLGEKGDYVLLLDRDRLEASPFYLAP